MDAPVDSAPARAGPRVYDTQRDDPFATTNRIDWPGPNRYRSSSGSPGPDYWQQHADYKIKAALDTGTTEISGSVEIRYTNNSPDTLRYVWLQADQNLYRSNSKGSALFPADSRWGVRGFQGGYTFTNVRVNGSAVEPRINDTMRGVLDTYGSDEAVKRAVAAGIDVLIQPLDVSKTIDAVLAGISEGRYTEARLDSSVRRVLETKRRLGLAKSKLVDLNGLRFLVGDSANAQVARAAAEKSITLVKDSLRQIPLLSDSAKVLSITVARRADLSAGNAFNAELRQRLPKLRTEFVSTEDAALNYPRLLAAADSADVTIVNSYVGQSWDAVSASAPGAFTNFVHTLVDRGRKPIVVAFGNPYLLQQLPWVSAYLVAWGGFPVSQTAAARALLGSAPISGHLPISIPPLATRGAGESRAAQRR